MSDETAFLEAVGAVDPNRIADSRATLRDLLTAVELTQQNATKISAALRRLKSTDAVFLLSAVWPRASEQIRNIFCRGEWHNDSQDTSIKAPLLLASRIASVDSQSAATLIEHARATASRTRNKGEGLLTEGLFPWLTAEGNAQPPFLSMKFSSLNADLQQLFVTGLARAATRAGKRGAKALESLRTWLKSLGEDVDSQNGLALAIDEAKRTLDQHESLAAKPASEHKAPFPPDERLPKPGHGGEATTAAPLKDGLPQFILELAQICADAGTRLKRLSRDAELCVHKAESTQTLKTDLDAARAQVQKLSDRCSQLEEQLVDLKRDLEAAETKIRDQAETLDDTQEHLDAMILERDHLQTALRSAQDGTSHLQAEVKKLDLERVEQSGEARKDERRRMGEQIASSIASQVREIREAQQAEASPDQYKFLGNMVNELFRILVSAGVPVRE